MIFLYGALLVLILVMIGELKKKLVSWWPVRGTRIESERLIRKEWDD